MKLSLFLLSVACSATAWCGATIETQAEPSLQWMTLRENPGRIQVVYPSGANAAKLTVTGLDGVPTVLSANAPAHEIEWRPFGDAEAPAGDDLYTLNLQFFNDTTPVGEPLVSKVAVLRDVFAGASVRAEGTKAWKKTRHDKVVVPFDADWTGAAAPVAVTARQGDVVAKEVETEARGWFGIWPEKITGWTIGKFEMTLGLDGAEPSATAELLFGVPGLLLMYR